MEAPPLDLDVLPLDDRLPEDDGRELAPDDRLPEDERELTPEERLRPADERELPLLERVPPTERLLGAEYDLDPVPTELGERVVGPR